MQYNRFLSEPWLRPSARSNRSVLTPRDFGEARLQSWVGPL